MELTADVLGQAIAVATKAMLEMGISPGQKDYGYKHDASGTPTVPGYAHGPGGLLTYPGVDPAVYSTIIGTLPGILGELPTRGSVFMNPLYEVITGVYAGTGSEKTEVCDDPIAGGIMKAGMVTAPFGRYERRTREIELNRIGQFNDRADPMDLRLQNRAPMPDAWGVPGGGDGGNPLLNEIDKALYERSIEFHRLLSRQVWNGDPTNNHGDAYREFAGLGLLVNTGYVDAQNNTRLYTMDSDVKNFNYHRVDQSGPELINNISYLARYTRSKASRQGLDPVRWVFVMREELFWELTAVWACSYMAFRCNNTIAGTGEVNYNLDSGDIIAMRDAMRTGRYLLVDGIRYDVILDDGILEYSNVTNGHVTPGCFSSDIYLIPLSVNGGQSVTFLEYFDFGNASFQSAIGTGLLSDVRGSGPWMEWSARKNQCFWFAAKIEPRIVLRTPWLAGRLTNVQYCPLQHTAEPFPSDPYYANGGTTSRSGPSYYSLWQH